MANDTVRIVGLREAMRGFQRAGKDISKEVRNELKEQVGKPVRDDAARLFAPISPRSASRFRVRVNQRGVFVDQPLRKTTGKRPDFGALQMRRALLPALRANRDEIEPAVTSAFKRVAARSWRHHGRT